MKAEWPLPEHMISIEQPEASKSKKAQKGEGDPDNREIFAGPLIRLLADLRERDGAQDDRNRREQGAAATTRNQGEAAQD